MPKTPEQEARETIGQMLGLAGWNVQDCRDANIHARFGVENLLGLIFGKSQNKFQDPTNLPDPGVLVQEIVEDLEAALEQFREIAEDLGEKRL